MLKLLVTLSTGKKKTIEGVCMALDDGALVVMDKPTVSVLGFIAPNAKGAAPEHTVVAAFARGAWETVEVVE